MIFSCMPWYLCACVRTFFLQMIHVNYSYTMSDHDLVSYIIEENKRRKKRRIVLTELYFESVLLGFAYLSEQRRPRELGCFSDDEITILGSICSKKCMMDLKLHAMITCD